MKLKNKLIESRSLYNFFFLLLIVKVFDQKCVQNISVPLYTGWPTKNGTFDTVDFQDFDLIII